jgi:pimeloyl-ACP methyl ester carboxylesterase
MRRATFRSALLAGAATTGLLAAAGGIAHGTDTALDVEHNFTAGFAQGFLHPAESPPGANDWDCRPGAEHPEPVVLVHGTMENMNDMWRGAAPLPANNGYCVYAFNYGGASADDPVQASPPWRTARPCSRTSSTGCAPRPGPPRWTWSATPRAAAPCPATT